MSDIEQLCRSPKNSFPARLILACCLCFVLSACGSNSPQKMAAAPASSVSDEAPAGPQTPRSTLTEVLTPTASGEVTYQSKDGVVTLDASDTKNGYVMIQYQGSADRVQIQIINPDESVNRYPLVGTEMKAFPLTLGDGTYQVNVYEHIVEQQYALLLSEELSVTLTDEFRPFLYPNQYVDYATAGQTLALARQLSEESEEDLGFVQNVFHYVITHISYDNALAADTPTNYIPNPDRTLQSGSGICFDYAALMTAMLRSQGIPTRLVVGYSGDVYHAWISVHLEEIGWVDQMIEFDGSRWTLMDPTLAANNSAETVKQYIGDGTHYTVKYYY